MFGQFANAHACRSEPRWVGRVGFTGNRLLTWAIGFELAILAVFPLVPPMPELLGGHLPTWLGHGALTVPAVWLADAGDKRLRARR